MKTSPDTVEKKADKYLDNKIRYSILFEEAGDGIFILNKGKIFDCNQKAQKLFSCDRSHLIGKTPFDFSPKLQPSGISSVREGFRHIRATESGDTQYFEWTHLRADGSLFDTEVSLVVIKLASAVYVQAIMRDITIRKRAVKELEQMKNQLLEENVYLQEEIKIAHDFEEIIGNSNAIKKAFIKVENVAHTDSTVLIMGETGTGKELIARAVHSCSLRKDRPLVKLNCANLPADLIESELFGHEKGAFTGATDKRIGRFELANCGTMFLDEIGELPLGLQSKLLRVLQSGEFERVGGTKTISADVRIIAATNRDLKRNIRERVFREDLFYRLNVFPILLPPLRDRKEDIPLLIKHFVFKHASRCGKKVDTVPRKIMEALQSYDWPGNVRELENIVERGLIISRNNRLSLGDWLPLPKITSGQKKMMTMAEAERQHIQTTLKLTNGRVSGKNGAAEILGLNPQTLYSRIKRLGITRKID
ncbi:MAG: sigma 54-interacting transcriptional regulator [Desulfotalea sp.]